VQFFDAAFRLIYTPRTSPETKFGERSSDAVQAYARVRAEHGKRLALPGQTASLWTWHDRAGFLRNRKGLPPSPQVDWGCPGDASAPDEGFHIP
jgi:hypothetical protein